MTRRTAFRLLALVAGVALPACAAGSLPPGSAGPASAADTGPSDSGPGGSAPADTAFAGPDGDDGTAVLTDSVNPEADTATGTGGAVTAEACLAHTESEPQCKDCCDCLDLSCADVVSCRDACMLHDFSQNDGSLHIVADAPLGPGGDYGQCTVLPDEISCKACCECDGHYACGDKAHCRDACALAGSPFAPLSVGALGPPVAVPGAWQFAEGPVWHPQLGAWLVADIDADTIYRIDAGAVSIWRHPSHHANGLAVAVDGSVLVAEQATHQVTRIAPDGSVSALATSWQGKPLNAPNDLALAADGTIYFTDPTFGLGDTPSALGFTGVYRIGVDGAVSLEAQLTGEPNGVALSASGKSLIVTRTTADDVLSFDLDGKGHVGKQHSFAKVQAPDGVAVDAAGNVYVAATENGKNVLLLLNPIGKHIGTLPLTEQPTNCGLGGVDGKTLTVTARTAVYQLTVPIPAP